MNHFFILKSKGKSENYINQDADKHKSVIEWDVDYDGDQADIDLKMDKDGEEENMHFLLTNSDLAKILSHPSEPLSLDERLRQDFLDSHSMDSHSMDSHSMDSHSMDSHSLPHDILKEDLEEAILQANEEDEPIKLKINVLPTSTKESAPKNYYIENYKPTLSSKSRKPSSKKTTKKAKKSSPPKKKKSSSPKKNLLTGKPPSRKKKGGSCGSVQLNQLAS